MSSIGQAIDALIASNVELWHLATQVKRDGKPDHTLPTEDRVRIFREVRRLNAKRSVLRWEIDSETGKGINETKIGYSE